MRIGVDCRPLQESYPSGVSLYTKELLQALVELPEAQKHTFVFFCNAARFAAGSESLQVLQQAFPTSNIEWNVRTLPNKLFTAGEVLVSRPSLRWMFGDVDVVFVPNMQFFPFRDTSVPFVLTVHDLSFVRYPECLSMKGRMRHALLWPRSFVRAAAQIITVSEHTKNDLIELFSVSPERIEVLYPGVHCAATSGELSKPYILSLATIEPRKNFDVLLQAFRLLRKEQPDIELVIAGGKGWKSARLLEEFRTTPGVRYEGYITEQKKQHLLSHAAVFVYPSLYEGFGFPPLEAQCYGVPVVAGFHSSLPEVLGDSAVYIDVLDANSLYRAMHHLLTDATFRQTYAQRGAVNIQRFQWQVTARKTFDMLQATAHKR